MSFLTKIIGESGISVRNTSEVPILVIASQLTPLHWGKVEPGETWNAQNHLGMGKVWFTVSVSQYDPNMEPTVGGVAARLAAITASMILPAVFFVGVAVLSGVTSVQGAKMTGVYSDGRTLTVTGRRDGNTYVLGVTQ